MSYYLSALKFKITLEFARGDYYELKKLFDMYIDGSDVDALCAECANEMNDGKNDHQLLKGALIALVLALMWWAFVAVLVYMFHR